MKLSFIELIPLQQIFPIESKLPFKTAYTFAKLGEILEKELKFYYNKMKEIINEYSEKDEEGNPIMTENGASVRIMADRIEECQAKMEELGKIEVDLGDISFTEDSLTNLELTTSQAMALMPLIKE